VVLRELLAEIGAIRERGWAMTVDYPLPERATLAVALPPLAGQPPMAITVGARKSRMLARHAAFLEALRETCGRVA
jgi:DNA-binding IclR family transcriptional regulator